MAGQHEHHDPGNTDPQHLVEDFSDDELAEILARFESGEGVAHPDPPPGWTAPVVTPPGGAS